MAKNTMYVVRRIPMLTVNRGVRPYIISVDSRGRYFAHEVGYLTQWAQVFNGVERDAHRINPSRRWANKYLRTWIVKPFKSYDEALAACKAESQKRILLRDQFYSPFVFQ